MRPCDANDYHTLTPVYWDKRETYMSARTFMCQHCLRMFDLHEISQRHESLKKLEEAEEEEV